MPDKHKALGLKHEPPPAPPPKALVTFTDHPMPERAPNPKPKPTALSPEDARIVEAALNRETSRRADVYRLVGIINRLDARLVAADARVRELETMEPSVVYEL
jgi:hypothetical protein